MKKVFAETVTIVTFAQQPEKIITMYPEKAEDLFIQIASINALSQEEAPVANYIRSFAEALGYSSYTDKSQQFTGSNTGNVFVPVNGGGEVMMMSHMDTARPTLGMKPVFHPDRITSDGTTVLGVDNRLGITALLYALRKMTAEGRRIRPFTLAFSVCEETTLAGSLHLEVPEGITRCFIFDSGYRTGNFISRATGAKRFSVTIKGKASHSGIAPEKGINAIKAAGVFIANIPLGRIEDDVTANIGTVQGGSAVNVVPDTVQLEGEVRSFTDEKVEKIVHLFRAEAEKAASVTGAKITFTDEWDFRPYTLHENSVAYREISEALTACSLKPTPLTSLGGSDANSLNGRGIPAVNIGIGAQNPHGNDEFVLLEDLYNAITIACNLMEAK